MPQYPYLSPFHEFAFQSMSQDEVLQSVLNFPGREKKKKILSE